MNGKSSSSDPRLRGIHEQHYRARHFLRLARRSKKVSTRFRNLIAAVYPGRAIVELMLESAVQRMIQGYKDKDASKNRKRFEEVIASQLPYYYLIEKIRIHDFHRFGTVPPDTKKREYFMGGPITLIAKKGVAAVIISSAGPKVSLTGDSDWKDKRSLFSAEGCFFDEESQKYLPLEDVVADYLGAMPEVIAEFEGLTAVK